MTVLNNTMKHFSSPGSAWSFRVIGHYAALPYFRVGDQQNVAGWNIYDGLWVPGQEPGALVAVTEIKSDPTSLHAITAEMDQMITEELEQLVKKEKK